MVGHSIHDGVGAKRRRENRERDREKERGRSGMVAVPGWVAGGGDESDGSVWGIKWDFTNSL